MNAPTTTTHNPPGKDFRRVFILSAMLAIVMLGFGMVIPVFPFYVEQMGARGTELGLLTAISPLMQLFFAPIWGGVSDRRGRKPVLVVGMLGYGVSMLLYGLATHLWMLFAARALGGILSAASLPTTYAYISDCTSEQDRGSAMGILGAATGLGMILGPGIGGWLATDNLALPFFITAGLALVSLLLIVVALPESRQPEAQPRQEKKRPQRTLRVWQDMLFSPVGVLLFLAFLVSFGLSNFQSIFGLYAFKKFNYDTNQVGIILTIAGLVSALTQGALTGPLTRRWGEPAIIKVTLLASAVGFGLLLLSSSFAGILVTTGLFVLPNALLRPAVIALTSKAMPLHQGTIMGLNNSLTSLGRIVGPIWAGFAFDLNVDYPYLTGIAIMLAGFVFCVARLSGQGAAEVQPDAGTQVAAQ